MNWHDLHEWDQSCSPNNNLSKAGDEMVVASCWSSEKKW